MIDTQIGLILIPVDVIRRRLIKKSQSRSEKES